MSSHCERLLVEPIFLGRISGQRAILGILRAALLELSRRRPGKRQIACWKRRSQRSQPNKPSRRPKRACKAIEPLEHPIRGAVMCGKPLTSRSGASWMDIQYIYPACYRTGVLSLVACSTFQRYPWPARKHRCYCANPPRKQRRRSVWRRDAFAWQTERQTAKPACGKRRLRREADGSSGWRLERRR